MIVSQLIALVGSYIKTKKCKFAQEATRFISENNLFVTTRRGLKFKEEQRGRAGQ